jgi:serine/threonine protein kinase
MRKIRDFYEFTNHILGKGSFGKVFEGICKMSGRRVAIKELNKKGMNEEELEYQIKELGILKSCFSKNVVEIIDVFEDSSVLQIVQEYI